MSKKAAVLGAARVMLQGSGPGFLNLPVFDAEDGSGGGGGTSLNDGSGTGGGDFLSTLSDDNKAFATEQGFKDIGSVFDGYRGLQEKQKGMFAMPGDDATPEQRQEFYAQMSKSWTPEGEYTFNMPDNLPDKFPYDGDFAKEAGGWFKEVGLPPHAAQTLHDKWVGKMAEVYTAGETKAKEASDAQAEAVGNAHRELVKQHGDPGSDGYKNHVAKAQRSLEGLKAADIDLSDWFAEKGALTKADENGDQHVIDPTAVNLLAFIHDKAFSEDALNDIGKGGGGENPFNLDKPDLQKQADLVQREPAKAKQLIEAAGRDPKAFGL